MVEQLISTGGPRIQILPLGTLKILKDSTTMPLLLQISVTQMICGTDVSAELNR